ncbi:MAG: aminopeptidase [Fibrobacteres bacterium]|nr:aminopeptidase [Fibrobacterota bacterium]
MNWYLTVMKNYVGFSGRARRKEYWMFCLFNMGFVILAVLLDNILGTAIKGVGYGLFYFLYALAVLLPSLAVGVRRLHDVGKSGWFLLIGLIPIIGGIWILILLCTDGNAAENKYGLNVKSVS